MNNVRVGTHGEIVIKKKLRERFGIETGQEVIEFDAGDHIAIIPVSSNPLKALSGKYNWKETTRQLKKMADDLALDEVKKRG